MNQILSQIPETMPKGFGIEIDDFACADFSEYQKTIATIRHFSKTAIGLGYTVLERRCHDSMKIKLWFQK